MSFLCSGLALLMLITTTVGCSSQSISTLVRNLKTPCNGDNDLTVSYNNGMLDECAVSKSCYSVLNEPFVAYHNAEWGGYIYYTLLVISADVSGMSLNHLRVYLIWAVAGITSNQVKLGDFPQANVLNIAYSAPRPSSGTYRYTFVLLREGNNSPNLNQSYTRSGFDLKLFLLDNNMCDSLVATHEIVVSA